MNFDFELRKKEVFSKPQWPNKLLMEAQTSVNYLHVLMFFPFFLNLGYSFWDDGAKSTGIIRPARSRWSHNGQ